MFLQYIKMNPPQVYKCSPSWTLLPPHTIPLGHPSAPAPSIQYCASNLDWQLISYMILYMFQCHSPKSSHPLPDFKQEEQTLSSVSGMEKCKGCVLLTGCCVGHSPRLHILPELSNFPGLRFQKPQVILGSVAPAHPMLRHSARILFMFPCQQSRMRPRPQRPTVAQFHAQS